MAFNGSIIRTIGYRLLLDDTDFNKSLETAQENTNRFNTRLKTMGRDISRFGRQMTTRATVPIVGLGTAAVIAASRFEEASSKFETVFKDQADTTRAWAEEQSSLLNRSSADWIGYLSTFQDTFVPLGFARDQAADLSRELVVLAEDLGSFNDIDTATVVRDLQSALVGNTETLRKYGVVAQETQIQAEAINSGLVDSEEAYRNLDGATRATVRSQAIYNLVLQGTQDAQGDAARTADSFANQMKGLQSEAKEMAIEFGQELLPVMTELVGKLSDAVGWFGDLDDGQKQAIVRTAAFVAAVGPAISIVGGLTRSIGSLGGALVRVFGSGAAGGIVGLAIAGVSALTVAATRSIRNMNEEFAEGAIEDFATIFKEAKDESLGMYENIVRFADTYGIALDVAMQAADVEHEITEEVRAQVEALREARGEEDSRNRSIRDQAGKYEEIVSLFDRMNTVSGGFSLLTPEEQDVERARMLQESVDTISEQYGVARQELAQMLLTSSELTEEQRDYLETFISQQEQVREELEEEELTRLRIAEQTSDITQETTEQNELQEEQNRLLQERNDLEAQRVADVIEERKQAADAYEQEITRIGRLEDAGILAGTDSITARLDAAQTYAESLAEIGFNGRRGDVGDDSLNDMLALIQQYNEALEDAAAEEEFIERTTQKINDNYRARKEAAEEARRAEAEALTEKKEEEQQLLDRKRDAEQEIIDANLKAYERYRDQRISLIEDPIERLEAQRDLEVQEAQERGEDTYWIEQYWADQIAQAKEEARERDLQRQEQYKQQMIASSRELYQGLQSVVSSYYDMQLAMIDQQMNEELRRKGLEDETDSERLEKDLEELEDKIAAEDDMKEKAALKEQKAELEKEIQKQKIVEEYAQKKADIQRQQAEMEKAFRIFDIMINTATAVTKALTAGPVAGPILASAIGALGAAQLGLVMNTPIPEFAEGGIVQQETQAIVGEAGPEAVIPLRPEVLSSIGRGIAEASGSIVNNNEMEERTQIINVYVGEDKIETIVNRGIENRTIRI